MNDSLTQGFVSGWGLPESNLREKETDPDPTSEEKLDPDPTLEKKADPYSNPTYNFYQIDFTYHFFFGIK